MRVGVGTGNGSYHVEIATGLAAGLLERLRAQLGERPLQFLVDSEVDRLHGGRLGEQLGHGRPRMCLAGGESQKSLAVLERVLRHLARTTPRRNAVVVAIGGGVVGDLGGLAAAVFLRGVAWVMVPTTLLAMVDSSIGGKTAVDLPEGKNLVGAFHQPAWVGADPELLTTLPEREWRSGLGEVAKYAIGLLPELFDWLEKHDSAVKQRDCTALAEMIGLCVASKAAIVQRDEREAGERRLLNLGHTLGHALEAAAGYGPLAHGEAVAIGLRFACWLAARKRLLGQSDRRRAEALLDALGLPLPDRGDLDTTAVIEYLQRDKKASGGTIQFVMPVARGRSRLVELELAELARQARGFLASW